METIRVTASPAHRLPESCEPATASAMNQDPEGAIFFPQAIAETVDRARSQAGTLLSHTTTEPFQIPRPEVQVDIVPIYLHHGIPPREQEHTDLVQQWVVAGPTGFRYAIQWGKRGIQKLILAHSRRSGSCVSNHNIIVHSEKRSTTKKTQKNTKHSQTCLPLSLFYTVFLGRSPDALRCSLISGPGYNRPMLVDVKRVPPTPLALANFVSFVMDVRYPPASGDLATVRPSIKPRVTTEAQWGTISNVPDDRPVMFFSIRRRNRDCWRRRLGGFFTLLCVGEPITRSMAQTKVQQIETACSPEVNSVSICMCEEEETNTKESCEFIIINCCLSTLPVSAHEEVSISHSLTHSPEAGEEESPNTQTKAASNQQRPSYLCKRPKDFCTAI
jgi:hypothetical protein